MLRRCDASSRSRARRGARAGRSRDAVARLVRAQGFEVGHAWRFSAARAPFWGCVRASALSLCGRAAGVSAALVASVLANGGRPGCGGRGCRGGGRESLGRERGRGVQPRITGLCLCPFECGARGLAWCEEFQGARGAMAQLWGQRTLRAARRRVRAARHARVARGHVRGCGSKYLCAAARAASGLP